MTRGKWILGCIVEVDMDGSLFDARIVRMPTDRDEAYVVELEDPDGNVFSERVIRGRVVGDNNLIGGLEIVDALHDLGFRAEPQESGWFLSENGKIRVVVEDGGTEVIAWTDPVSRVIDWKAQFSSGTPAQVIVCALTGAS
jgi:hypothetical protein